MKRELLSAPVGSERKILANAADSLVEIIGKVFHDQWKGTPWDFNGATSKPKEGSIACGYFVTGLLEDAGYKLNRSKLSTCPSLTMMRTLTAPGEVENLSALPFEDFVKRINNRGVNLYIVGLDFHTGFIVNDGKEVWFLHSNYIKKIGVVKETMLESVALKASKTKFLVCLTDSKKFLTTWLLN